MQFLAGRTGLGAIDLTLAALKQHVDQCIARLPFSGRSDSDASIGMSCQVDIKKGLEDVAKQTYLDATDRAILFNIASNILLQWRNTNSNGARSDTETVTRTIAADKLAETADAVSPTLAVQHFSSAGRIETDAVVLSHIINGLRDLLTSKSVAPSVRSEALTTLRILADELGQPNPGVRISAQVALQLIAEKSGSQIEIGPVVVTTIPRSRSRQMLVPIAAMVTTAAVSAGALWFVFGRSSSAQLSAGPLRRRVEAKLKRRKVR